MITKQVGRAMATQLDRVNSLNIQQRLAELEEENRNLREELRNLRQQKQPALIEEGYQGKDVTTMYNGRPVVTLLEAADRAGVNYHAARRYCLKGHWAYYVDGNNRYHVYLDQPLSIPTRVTRRKN